MKKENEVEKETYAPFWSFGHKFIEYYYQTKEGKQFTCIAADITIARWKRDKWLKK